MKKTFRFMLAAAAAALMVGCSKDTPAPTPTPKPEEGGEEGGEKEELYADYVIRVDIKDYYHGFGYSGVPIDFSQYKTDDGQTIMEVFGYSSVDDFCQNLCDANVGDKDVKFVLFDGDTKFIDESGSNTNGIGHWVTKQGQKVGWGETSAFFTEGNYTSAGDDGSYSLAGVLGSKPDVVTAEDDGMEYVIIEGFSSSEYDVAVEFHVYVTAEAPTVEVTKKGEKTLNFNVTYSAGFAATALFTEEEIAEVESALGVSVLEATAYGVNPDGSLHGISGQNFWFDAAGNVSSYGEGCGIDINKDSGAWTFCNYPDENLIGQTVKGAIMLVNSSNEGYLVKVNVTLEEPTEVEYPDVTGEDEYCTVAVDGYTVDIKALPGKGYAPITIILDNAKLVEDLGLEDEAALAAGISATEPTVVVWGLNADGQKAVDGDGNRINSGEGPFGHWFDASGNVGSWGETASMCFNVKTLGNLVYVKACEMDAPEAIVAGYTQTYKQAFVAGEKEVVVTYNVSIVEAL